MQKTLTGPFSEIGLRPQRKEDTAKAWDEISP
ncbi:unnamed protein product [Strongylus vulgaris]|uniref:Uncharacterized protein n=1 Tax=Strongylus vulgaris TaxID=40348 RepID=A0A3P7JQ71_STRVU|nr:unnamed protein product [Strongylus vulgaris]